MTSLRIATLLAVGIALAATAHAQNLSVFPTEIQNAQGNTFENSFPYGFGISRTQAVLERGALAIPNGRQITKIKLRQEPGGTFASRLVQLAVYMGGTDKTAATAGSDFLANYSNGTPRTLVFGPAVYTLPALLATQPPYTEATLDLTTPYTFDANENLVLEFVVTANNNANQSFSYRVDGSTFFSPATNFGAGCLTSANHVPALNGTGGYVGGSVSFALSQAPSNSTLYFHLNVVPSTPILGDPFGAPGCSLLVNPLSAVLATAPGGSFNYSIPIPNNPSFFGVSIYGQAIIFDLFANALGFAASNGTEIRVGRQMPMTKIEATSSATAATGTVTRNRGPIFLFEHN